MSNFQFLPFQSKYRFVVDICFQRPPFDKQLLIFHEKLIYCQYVFGDNGLPECIYLQCVETRSLFASEVQQLKEEKWKEHTELMAPKKGDIVLLAISNVQHDWAATLSKYFLLNKKMRLKRRNSESCVEFCLENMQHSVLHIFNWLHYIHLKG